MGIFKRKEERAEEVQTTQGVEVSADILKALLGNGNTITREQAIEIPTVSACVSKIAGTIKAIPIKLYKKENDEVKEILDDNRLKLLNEDTKDTLTASQFWEAMIEDYYLGKGGYAYINKEYSEFKSLHYVENGHIGFMVNVDPIFKDYKVLVDGKEYEKYNFLKILRNTKDGHSSKPVQETNPVILEAAYHELKYEKNLVQKGGNKKGFLKSENSLTKEAATALKEAFKKLYKSDEESVVVLNKGLSFQESSNSCVEMQLNENKTSNSTEIAMIFGVPVGLLRGSNTGEGAKADLENYIDNCIVPLLSDIESSLDRDLLTEIEKEEGYYFAFDTRELKRGNIKDRYEAYEIAYRNNFLQVDEIRAKEDMKPLGFSFIKLGLDSVLYDIKTGTIYTPNTNEMTNMKSLKGGGENEDGS